MQIDFLKQRKVNCANFLVERDHPGTGCRINCVAHEMHVVMVDMSFSQKYRISLQSY